MLDNIVSCVCVRERERVLGGVSESDCGGWGWCMEYWWVEEFEEGGWVWSLGSFGGIYRNCFSLWRVLFYECYFYVCGFIGIIVMVIWLLISIIVCL